MRYEVVREKRVTQVIQSRLCPSPTCESARRHESGHHGSTLHANSAREALVKMCTLPLLAGDLNRGASSGGVHPPDVGVWGELVDGRTEGDLSPVRHLTRGPHPQVFLV